MELIWTRPAQYSLLDIAAYVELHFNQRLAKKVVHDIRKAANALKRFPEIGRKVEGMPTTRTIRCLTCKTDQIYYYTEEDRVAIIMVWDSRKDPAALLEQLKQYCENICNDDTKDNLVAGKVNVKTENVSSH